VESRALSRNVAVALIGELGMEIGDAREVFDAMKSAIGLLKGAKDLLPDSKNKKAAEDAIEKANAAAHIAEAKLAQTMGYPLCRCHWPPTIMTVKLQGGRQSVYNCGSCGVDFVVGQSGQIKRRYVKDDE
jgi:hypothetical protein